MNTWAKGTKIEKLRRKYYEDMGYICQTWPKVKFAEQDLFGAFDLIAIRAGKMILEQIKSKANTMPSVDRHDIEDMVKSWYDLPDHICLNWVGYNVEKNEWKVIDVSDPIAFIAQRWESKDDNIHRSRKKQKTRK